MTKLQDNVLTYARKHERNKILRLKTKHFSSVIYIDY